MKRLYHIKETLLDEIQSQLSHLECVDTKELGEAIDMIKDLEEAIYYSTITEAMHGREKKEEEWEEPTRYYYGGGRKDREYPMEWKDPKEGHSPMQRRKYMEAKEKHHDKSMHIQELESYMKELSQDVVEMITGASPEEKQLLKTKLTTLISKIDQA